jgi:hypothetical protein
MPNTEALQARLR